MTTVEIHHPGRQGRRHRRAARHVFDVHGQHPLMHQVVVAQLAAARQGTHETKTRGEVPGGGKKPYRQKGTGRARQGSTRAPQFTGGGIVARPARRTTTRQRTPKKMKAAALRGALSDRARAGQVHVRVRARRRRHPVHQDGAHRARRRVGERGEERWSCSARRRGRLAQPAQPARACTCSRRTSSTPTTCWSATTWCSPRRRSTSSSTGRSAPPQARARRPASRSSCQGRAGR